jgi:hypothetical protein
MCDPPSRSSVAARYGVGNRKEIEFSFVANTLPLRNGISLALAAELELALYTVSLRFPGRSKPQPQRAHSYLILIGKVADNTGDQAHVDEGDHGMARGPAPVLVAVRI